MSADERSEGRAMPPGADDTIAAIATPAGRGAIAVVRVSGPDAHAVAGRVVRPWPIPERVARLVRLVDPESGELIDRPVVTTFGAGRSFTGEPTVEIATHGGYVVPAAVLAALVRAGAREAFPGEFTRRAVLNGKLDLIQAEAVGDLIDARSGAMCRAALAQLDGGLSRRVTSLRDELIALEALLAYDVDFPEEDDGPVPRAQVSDACAVVVAALDQLLGTAPAGEVVREGATVVIAGAPNVGKSSLFNAILGRARAIVTDVPGTTRDAIEAVVDAGRWPLRLVDTAGLRETSDVVERLGIEVSERYLAAAHVVLACGTDDREVARVAERVRALSDAPVVGVRTKADLGGADQRALESRGPQAAPARAAGGSTRRGSPPDDTLLPNEAASGTVAARAGPIRVPVADPSGRTAPEGTPADAGRAAPRAAALVEEPVEAPAGAFAGRSEAGALIGPIIEVSAERGTGLQALLDATVATLDRRYGAPALDAPVVTRARHVRALGEARAELAQFEELWRTGALPATVAAVHVRSAVHALEELVGSVDVEDVLERVFSTFCVGK